MPGAASAIAPMRMRHGVCGIACAARRVWHGMCGTAMRCGVCSIACATPCAAHRAMRYVARRAHTARALCGTHWRVHRQNTGAPALCARIGGMPARLHSAYASTACRCACAIRVHRRHAGAPARCVSIGLPVLLSDAPAHIGNMPMRRHASVAFRCVCMRRQHAGALECVGMHRRGMPMRPHASAAFRCACMHRRHADVSECIGSMPMRFPCVGSTPMRLS